MDEVLAAFDNLPLEDQKRLLALLNHRAENDKRTDDLLKDLQGEGD
jgi:hypothetical protein